MKKPSRQMKLSELVTRMRYDFPVALEDYNKLVAALKEIRDGIGPHGRMSLGDVYQACCTALKEVE